MPNSLYNWKRFWCPTTGYFALDNEGYLYDPDTSFGSAYSPDLKSLEGILPIPCLALLGEPGIGKSAVLEQNRPLLVQDVERRGDKLLWLDLAAYGSEDRLVRAIFGSREFADWLSGSYILHVFLDSLDECRLRIDNVAALLVEEQKRVPVDRLFFRVVCRSAEWRVILEEGMKKIWGEDKTAVYELAPLRRVDVIEAARAEGLDPEAFLDETEHMNAVPLATKPITLRFLLSEYQRTGSFPPGQADLYRHGCRQLCEEANLNRLGAGLLGAFDPDQRLVIAARIATVTVFANRSAIYTRPDRGDVPESDVTIHELRGRSEVANDTGFDVTDAGIREALSTGLFSSRGPGRLGWAHKSYAEFLAAHYLHAHNMNLKQIVSLISHPGDPEHRIVTQLHGTAAWLASMESRIFKYVMELDPEVLLRSDVARADAQDRKSLVDNLLRLIEEGKISDRVFYSGGEYRGLNHPDLAEQLGTYIRHRDNGAAVREAAIHIIEACRVQPLLEELPTTALDAAQPYTVRLAATLAVAKIGNVAAKHRLMPLATGNAGDDPNDELKGAALRALWPDDIDSMNLFATLTRPKQARLFGLYRLFLERDLVQHLQPSSLPVALAWTARNVGEKGPLNPFGHLVDAIMWRAWHHLNVAEVLPLFAQIALQRIEIHDQIVDDLVAPEFKRELAENDDRRRCVLKAAFPLLAKSDEKNYGSLFFSSTPIVMSKDVPWLAEQLGPAWASEQASLLTKLITAAFSWQDPSHAEAIYTASMKNPAIADAFSWVLKPEELSYAEAAKLREDYLT
jgi:predicted NACHT family NTPase